MKAASPSRPFFAALLLGLSLPAANQAQASEALLGLSDKTIEARYSHNTHGQFTTPIGWLHHADQGDMITLGFYGQGQQDRIEGRVGGYVFFLDTDNVDQDRSDNDAEGQGLAVGGDLRIWLYQKLNLDLEVHHAPGVTAFGELDSMTALGAKLGFMAFDTVELFAGYRDVRATLDDEEKVKLDDSLYLGMRIQF